jgi:hypothetical protein
MVINLKAIISSLNSPNNNHSLSKSISLSKHLSALRMAIASARVESLVRCQRSTDRPRFIVKRVRK